MTRSVSSLLGRPDIFLIQTVIASNAVCLCAGSVVLAVSEPQLLEAVWPASRLYDASNRHIGGANEVRHLLFVLGAGVERRLPEIRRKGRQARFRRHRNRCSL